jgi:hypothetical protein
MVADDISPLRCTGVAVIVAAGPVPGPGFSGIYSITSDIFSVKLLVV